MKTRSLLILLALCPALAPAQGIKVAFHNGATTGNAMLTRPAGTVVDTATDTWNNVLNNGGVGLNFSNFVLNNAAGADSGARLAVTTGFATFNNIAWGTNSQDWVMMEGWYGFRDAENLTVTNLPANLTSGGYSAIIYGDIGGTRSMDYVINGVTRTIEDTGAFAGTFTSGVNYVAFTGLTDPTLAITGNTTKTGRSGINGLRIEPGIPDDLLQITSFSSPTPYAPGGSTVTLNWQATPFFDTYSIDGGIGDVTAMTTNGTGSTTVQVNSTTTFTLTATKGAVVRTRQVTISTEPDDRLFQVLPTIARDSAEVRLVWDFPGATALTISDGTSDVYTAPDAPTAAAGFTVLGPINSDTTFTATATFAGSAPTVSQTTIDIRSGADPVSYEETVLADMPLAFYRFEESANSPLLLDHSPNDSDSVNLSATGITRAQPGAVGSAWRFDLGSARLALNADPSAGSFTVSALARPDLGLKPTGGANSIIGQQDLAGTGRSIIQSSFVDGQIRSFLGGPALDLAPRQYDKVWYHVVLVYDSPRAELRTYIDGTLASTLTGIVPETSTGDWVIGSNKQRTNEFFQGLIDEIAVFPIALDDPNDDGDTADSRISAHRQAFLRDAAPLLGFATATPVIGPGDNGLLVWKTGDAATSIDISPAPGDVTGATTGGYGESPVSPSATTTYTITVNGTETAGAAVTVLGPIAISQAQLIPGQGFVAQAVNLIPGRSYDMFFSLDLMEPWTPLNVQVVAGAATTATFTDAIADPVNDPKAFYRVEEIPELP